MTQTIGSEELGRMLRTAAAKVRQAVPTLSQLDSVIGDGDHGTTMDRAMGLIDKALDAAKGAAPKAVLNDVGWAVLGVDGGASGPLLGMFFLGMSEAVGEGAAVDAKGVAAMFEGGLKSLQQQTKAVVGDKTMMDALMPAVTALRGAADGGASVAAAMAKAAEAAEVGAASTKDLQARFGRARNLGERSKGYQDPGATSLSLLLRGMADALA
jgi:dihydroxyacetone kinase-like protein